MQNIKAVGFDLFNTLISMETIALKDAMVRLYREAVLQFLQQTKRDGKESHNRFWITAALAKQGLSVSPEDPHISAAVESYFSAFVHYTKLIPGTKEMLGILQKRYRIGLLSNFTHPPAAKNIMSELGLIPFFEVVLISGDLGYRKPHGSVFEELIDQLGVQRDEIARACSPSGLPMCGTTILRLPLECWGRLMKIQVQRCRGFPTGKICLPC
jgi:putative hydrolase of the HAD superfamily